MKSEQRLPVEFLMHCVDMLPGLNTQAKATPKPNKDHSIPVNTELKPGAAKQLGQAGDTADDAI